MFGSLHSSRGVAALLLETISHGEQQNESMEGISQGVADEVFERRN